MKPISWFYENSQRIRKDIFEEVTIAKMKLYEDLIEQGKDGPDAVEYISAIYGTPEEILDRLDESLNLGFVSHNANNAVLTAINLATGLESRLKYGEHRR